MMRFLAKPIIALAIGSVIPLAGCTTIRAARDLASSNPVCGIDVSAPAVSPGETRIIEWSADYRDPPPFEGFVWIPGYTVTRRGSFPLPRTVEPNDIYVERRDEPRVKLSAEPVELQACLPFHLYGAEPSRRHTPASADACDREVVLRASDAEHDAHETVIPAVDSCGDEITMAALPVEVPYQSPERWAWLVAAPVVDVVVLPVNILIVGTIVIVASIP